MRVHAKLLVVKPVVLLAVAFLIAGVNELSFCRVANGQQNPATCLDGTQPPPVDLNRAFQLANASGLAYTEGVDAITKATYFKESKLVTPPLPKEITIGFDSVLIGRTDTGVLVSFRGTLSNPKIDPMSAIAEDWLNDAKLQLASVSYADGKVHSGFADSLDNLWKNGFNNAFKAAYKTGDTVLITGHSKGGALAALAALRLMSETLIPDGVTPTAVITFGAPRTGDEAFASAYNAKVDNHWRFEHRNDVVAHLPPRPSVLTALSSLKKSPRLAGFFKKIGQSSDDYTPVGNLCFLNASGKLERCDGRALEWRRDFDLVLAGDELVDDHYIDAYIAAIKALPPAP